MIRQLDSHRKRSKIPPEVSVAAMAELADAQDSGSCVRKDVEVRLLLAANEESWMHLALDQARAARAMDEVPIGCIIIHEPTGRIIGRGHNRRITDRDPTAHAEVL